MFSLRILALIIIALPNLACQTSRLKDFDKLLLGQEKDTVLDIIGSPTYRERIQGQDRWTYIIYETDIRHEKVLYFLDGFMTYRGLPIPPLITAEEQDSINAEKNIQLDLQDQLDRQRNLKQQNQSKIKTNNTVSGK